MTRIDESAHRKKVYAAYKAHGICVICKRRRARKNRTKCPECARAHALYMRARYDDFQAEAAEAGLCVKCRKRPSKPNRKRCHTCLRRQCKADVRMLSKNPEACTRCHRRSPAKNYKECAACLKYKRLYKTFSATRKKEMAQANYRRSGQRRRRLFDER